MPTPAAAIAAAGRGPKSLRPGNGAVFICPKARPFRPVPEIPPPGGPWRLFTNCSGEIRVKTNKGKISGSISDLVGTNNFLNTDKSVIDIKFDQYMKFNLSASSSKRNVSINYASISDSKNEFQDVLINGGDPAKKITLSAKYEISISNIKGE